MAGTRSEEILAAAPVLPGFVWDAQKRRYFPSSAFADAPFSASNPAVCNLLASPNTQNHLLQQLKRARERHREQRQQQRLQEGPRPEQPEQWLSHASERRQKLRQFPQQQQQQKARRQKQELVYQQPRHIIEKTSQSLENDQVQSVLIHPRSRIELSKCADYLQEPAAAARTDAAQRAESSKKKKKRSLYDTCTSSSRRKQAVNCTEEAHAFDGPQPHSRRLQRQQYRRQQRQRLCLSASSAALASEDHCSSKNSNSCSRQAQRCSLLSNNASVRNLLRICKSDAEKNYRDESEGSSFYFSPKQIGTETALPKCVEFLHRQQRQHDNDCIDVVNAETSSNCFLLFRALQRGQGRQQSCSTAIRAGVGRTDSAAAPPVFDAVDFGVSAAKTEQPQQPTKNERISRTDGCTSTVSPCTGKNTIVKTPTLRVRLLANRMKHLLLVKDQQWLQEQHSGDVVCASFCSSFSYAHTASGNQQQLLLAMGRGGERNSQLQLVSAADVKKLNSVLHRQQSQHRPHYGMWNDMPHQLQLRERQRERPSDSISRDWQQQQQPLEEAELLRERLQRRWQKRLRCLQEPAGPLSYLEIFNNFLIICHMGMGRRRGCVRILDFFRCNRSCSAVRPGSDSLYSDDELNSPPCGGDEEILPSNRSNSRRSSTHSDSENTWEGILSRSEPARGGIDNRRFRNLYNAGRIFSQSSFRAGDPNAAADVCCSACSNCNGGALMNVFAGGCEPAVQLLQLREGSTELARVWHWSGYPAAAVGASACSTAYFPGSRDSKSSHRSMSKQHRLSNAPFFAGGAAAAAAASTCFASAWADSFSAIAGFRGGAVKLFDVRTHENPLLLLQSAAIGSYCPNSAAAGWTAQPQLQRRGLWHGGANVGCVRALKQQSGRCIVSRGSHELLLLDWKMGSNENSSTAPLHGHHSFSSSACKAVVGVYTPPPPEQSIGICELGIHTGTQCRSPLTGFSGSCSNSIAGRRGFALDEAEQLLFAPCPADGRLLLYAAQAPGPPLRVIALPELLQQQVQRMKSSKRKVKSEHLLRQQQQFDKEMFEMGNNCTNRRRFGRAGGSTRAAAAETEHQHQPCRQQLTPNLLDQMCFNTMPPLILYGACARLPRLPLFSKEDSVVSLHEYMSSHLHRKEKEAFLQQFLGAARDSTARLILQQPSHRGTLLQRQQQQGAEERRSNLSSSDQHRSILHSGTEPAMPSAEHRITTREEETVAAGAAAEAAAVASIEGSALPSLNVGACSLGTTEALLLYGADHETRGSTMADNFIAFSSWGIHIISAAISTSDCSDSGD